MVKRKKRKIYFLSQPKTKRIVLGFLNAFLILLFSSLSFVIFVFILYAKDLPRPERFFERELFQPTRIYDQEGKVLLYTIFGEEKREVVSLEEIPVHLRQAVIAVEDANFYHHIGIEHHAIFRAILVNLKLKKPVQGGSTISQQLIRSTFLTSEKTIERKMKEIILTLELERRYSKDQILEWYLNQVPFGSNCYGVQSASKTFFNKPVQEISLAEAATLAALIKSPSYLSPYGEHKDKLLQRKNYVLKRMKEEGYIDEETFLKTKEEEVVFVKTKNLIKAPHFVFNVQKKLFEEYGEEFLKQNGLKVYTTLDWKLQQKAEEAIKNGVERNKNFRAYNAALVAIKASTGEVLALVGSADYFVDPYPSQCEPGKNCLFEPDFDVATLGLRQPGSAFKPFAYVTAFEKGYSDNYIVIDEETNFGIWGGKPYIPQNYDGLFRGPVTLKQALAQSLNVPSVKVFLYLAGIEDTIENAKEFGITTLKDASFYGPSLVLGGGEVKLIDMVSAYSVFANQGLKVGPTMILKIENEKEEVIYQYKPQPRRVIASEPTIILNNVLSDNEARAPMFGTNSPLNIEGVAVKTGTTQYYNDGWTIGYNKSIVVGVWAGNNDNSPSFQAPGVVLAAPIWREVMLKAIEMNYQ